MKETKYVAFSTPKGGVGKTTLTVLVHYPQIRYIRSRGDTDCGKYAVHGLSWEWEDGGELAITVESREMKYGDINNQ